MEFISTPKKTIQTMTKYYILSTKYSLQERQTKKNGKLYDVVFRIMDEDGNASQKKLSGFSTKTLAKQAYTEFVTANCELAKNNPTIMKKRAEIGKEAVTVEILAKTYLQSIRNQVKDSTVYDKENFFRLIFIPRFGSYKLNQLTKQELLKWQDELWSSKNPRTNDYYSYKYLSKIRTYMSVFLSWCAERNEGFTNYLMQIKKPKRRTSKTEMQFWTREEFDKFISVVDKPVYHTFFSTLFFTGRRKGEVLALSPDDVKSNSIKFNKSLTRKTLTENTYEITSTKTEKVASTPICEPLKKELQNYEVPEGNFYFGGDTPLAENTIRRAFNAYAEKAGVKQIRIHDLRHSFVSMLIHLGANLTVVADLIGDTLEQVTKTYAHLYEEDKMIIIGKIT